MRKVSVQAPGSCGEFIQGFYGPEPCLVSCPVDLYTKVTITEGPAQRMLCDKAARMLDLVFREYGLPRDEKHRIDVSLTSEIPVEKGMASSTADLAAVARALGAYFDLPMDADRIAGLCAAIEPTDNIMYPKLNLFDHMTGQVLMDFDAGITTPLLIIAFAGKVNTLGFHSRGEKRTAREIDDFGRALETFQEGLAAGDLRRIGEACTQSARLNQKKLYKPHLEGMISLSRNHGGHGVITGHSGTVIGVMYEEAAFDYRGFMDEFLNLVPKEDYDALFLKNIISGGLTVAREA